MINVTKVQDISVLHLYGEVTMLELELIQKMIESFKKCRYRKFLLDLAEVDHIHFEAIRKLVREAKVLRAMKGDLKIVYANPQTLEVMKFTGADQCFEDFGNIAEAILSFLKNPDPSARHWEEPATVQASADEKAYNPWALPN